MTLKFTKEQRAILINQMEILKRVDPQNSDEYEKNIDILYNGFSYFYSEVCGEIEDEFPEIITRQVFDILNMYRTLYFSYQNLTEEEKDEISERDVLFQGFDGNEEPYHYSFVNYVVKRAGLYSEMRDLLEEGKIELNSHRNRISYYNELLSRWSQVSKETNEIYLTLQQIKTVLGK
ncbi:YfbU family protein [Bacillus subtilis]|uniref:YfbU family protein n=1 Tax=Bacillus subtilis TaxID=1423 RepID=UPI002349BA17|nr:YfbU family protein [Bacillus subtilis]MEC2274728.1 YfbU family protein [Bacillus subtilis]WCL62833.1 YfbU family protein [Bacillus subtilis]